MPVIKLYCQSKVLSQIHNFNRSVRRNGESVNPEDERLMSTFITLMFEECIKNEVNKPY